MESTIWQQLRLRAVRHPRRIVLADGSDERAVWAAVQAVQQRIAEPTLLGPRAPIQALWKRHGGTGDAPSIDPVTLAPEALDQARSMLLSLSKFRTLTTAEAATRIHDPLVYGSVMLKSGLVDGFIGGATRTTADTLRAVFSIIGLAPKTSILFGFFLMSPATDPADDPILMADCAVIPEPSLKQLTQIGVAAADAYRRLIGREPRVAYLSFSTHGSAGHPKAELMRQAAQAARNSAPKLLIEGEWQADAALDAGIARMKGVGDSPMAGRANVLVVPDLNAGNIGYKLAQRLGHGRAVGPVLWGMAQPANDLSRGCGREDILDLMALTAIQVSLKEGVPA